MWLVKDVCGFVLALLTWNLILYAEFVVVYILLWSYPWNNFKVINLILFNSLLALAFISHLRSMFTDPGTIKLKLLPYKKTQPNSKPFYYIEDGKNSERTLSDNHPEESVSLLMESNDEDNCERDKLPTTPLKSSNYAKSYFKETVCLDSEDDSDDNTEMFIPNTPHIQNNGLFHKMSSSRSKNVVPIGFLPNNNFPNKYQPVFRCLKCYSLKPERAHHCSTCKKCINKMDHHCPWINNCVGESNQKFFVLFNLYVMLSGFHTLYLSGTYTYQCLQSDWQDCSKTVELPTSFLLIVFLIFEALLFSIFCSIMTGMQIHRILTDQTAVEALQKKSFERLNDENLDLTSRRNIQNSNSERTELTSNTTISRMSRKRRVLYNLKEVFGDKLSFNWLSPLHTPHFKNTLRESYGFVGINRAFLA